MNLLNSVAGVITGGLFISLLIAATTMGFYLNIQSLVVWIHVMAGITWIGLLYYFNFVQVPALAEAAADEGGPGGAGITKYVAPRALWWFRWAALVTWLSGAFALWRLNILHDAFTLGMMGDTFNTQAMIIGVGAWLGTIMLFNVWVFIWPNQKKILGIVEASEDKIAKARKVAFLASRTNTLLSIPMLMSMVGYGHGGFFI
ncbi:MAG: urate hydroxylase PuuD [Woeseiaceae bacterium]|nr:urate hydroxylase PuuD [Woeseiaceae bacterium]